MNSTEKTLQHIKRVQDLMGEAASELIRRGAAHDASKFTPEEAGPLAEMDALIEREGNVPFGSPEYEERKKLLGPMLGHHYIYNSHHPEHYQFEYGGNCVHGVNGMDLFDVLEMFIDWKAASERGEQPSMALKAACEKYHVSEQLAGIMRNTARRLGWDIE